MSRVLHYRSNEIPLHAREERVLSVSVDTYLINAIAPGHLLTVLISYLLDGLFKKLGDTDKQRRVDVEICTSLK